MFKKILKWFDGGYDKEFFKKHEDAIQKSNSKIIGISLMSIALFLTLFIIIESITDALNISVIAFSVMLGIVLVLFAVHKLFTKNSFLGTIIICCIFVVLFLAFLIFEETYYMRTRNAIIYYAFIVALPITMIAPVYATFNVSLLSFIIFSVMSYIYKEPTIFAQDVLFGVCCLIAGTFFGRYVLLNTYEGYELRDKLEYQSRYDPLTNIYNRRAGHKKLEEVLASEDKVALAMIDIDDFKNYNDTYGHVKGDEVLRTIASIFLYHAKKHGFFVSRFGGEEFLFVTFGANMEIMESLLEECSKDMKLAHIEDRNSRYGTVTFSAGFTQTYKCKDISALVETADKALYTAKNSGKNAIVFKAIDEE